MRTADHLGDGGSLGTILLAGAAAVVVVDGGERRRGGGKRAGGRGGCGLTCGLRGGGNPSGLGDGGSFAVLMQHRDYSGRCKGAGSCPAEQLWYVELHTIDAVLSTWEVQITWAVAVISAQHYVLAQPPLWKRVEGRVVDAVAAVQVSAAVVVVWQG